MSNRKDEGYWKSEVTSGHISRQNNVFNNMIANISMQPLPS